MHEPSPSHSSESRPPETFAVRVLRQDGPGRRSYWQRFRVAYEPDMNCISVLQKIAERPVTIDGQRVAPVAWECNCLEEVCGACTMLVNGACARLARHWSITCCEIGPARSSCGR